VDHADRLLIAGIVLALAYSSPSAEMELIATFAGAAFLIGEIPIRVIEGVHDARLKRMMILWLAS
jgi:hypothetical protein